MAEQRVHAETYTRGYMLAYEMRINISAYTPYIHNSLDHTCFYLHLDLPQQAFAVLVLHLHWSGQQGGTAYAGCSRQEMCMGVVDKPGVLG